MDVVPYLAALSALAALALAFFFYKSVEKESPGNDRMVFLMTEIQKGAKAFLKKEYTWVSGFVVIMMALLAIVIVPLAAVSYLLGAVLSATAGYAGMTVATMANARTTEAAKSGPGKALPVAFRGGAVMGFSVAGLALLGLMLTYLTFVVWLEVDQAFEIVTAYGLGASTIALFSARRRRHLHEGRRRRRRPGRQGRGRHPRGRPSQPGDDRRQRRRQRRRCRRHGRRPLRVVRRLDHRTDLVVRIRRAGAAGVIDANQAGDDGVIQFFVFPMFVAFIGMVASIIGSFLVKGGESTDSKHLSRALHLGTNVAMGLTAIGVLVGSFWIFGGDAFPEDKPWGLAVSVIGGLIAGWALGKTAEYYTSDHYKPVRNIAQQSETGPATTVLKGISTGMVSVAASVILILFGVGIAYWGGEQTLGSDSPFGGLYGIAVAAIGMLATTGIVVSVDAYGPIADNAGGIAEMAELDPIGPRSHRRPRLARQHDRRRRQGLRRRLGRADRAGAVQELRVRRVDGVGGGQDPQPQHRRRRRVHRAVHRSCAAVPVRRADHRRGRPCCRSDDRRGAPPVPRDPRPARRQARRHPRLGTLCRHLDRGVAARR